MINCLETFFYLPLSSAYFLMVYKFLIYANGRIGKKENHRVVEPAINNNRNRDVLLIEEEIVRFFYNSKFLRFDVKFKLIYEILNLLRTDFRPVSRNDE